MNMKKLSSKWAKLGQVQWCVFSLRNSVWQLWKTWKIFLFYLLQSLTVCAHMRIAVLFKCVSAYSVDFCLYKLYWRTRIKKESMNWFFFQMLLATDSFCCKFFICSSPLNHNCLSSLEMWRLYLAWQGSGLKIVVKVRKRHKLYMLI